MLEIAQLPAEWDDNFIFILHNQEEAVVIDPTDATLVKNFLTDNSLKLNRIINTHHHPDHIHGIEELVKDFHVSVSCSSYDKDRVPFASIFFEPGTDLEILGSKVKVIDVTGHTLGQIAYYFEEEKALFSGDCLFGLGCGRLFEGTAEMLQKSFQRIMDLPEDTMIYCSHEYTLANANFQEAYEYRNDFSDYKKSLEKTRQQGNWTVPLSLKEQMKWNLFLRWDDNELKSHLGIENLSPVEFVAYLRKKKDQF